MPCVLCLQIALASSLTTARQMVGQLQRSYELSMSEDKDLDKGFKKELSDCEPYTDQLYKLYKKRPRLAAILNVRTYLIPMCICVFFN